MLGEKARGLGVVHAGVDPRERDADQHVDADGAEDGLHPYRLVTDDPVEDHDGRDQHEHEHDVRRPVAAVTVEEGLEQVRGVGDHDQHDPDGEAAGAHV